MHVSSCGAQLLLQEQGAGQEEHATPEQACIGCRQAHALCDRKKPCGRCVQLGKTDSCRPTPARKRGRPPKSRTPQDGHQGPAAMVIMTKHAPQRTLKPAGASATTMKAGQLPQLVPGEALTPLMPRPRTPAAPHLEVPYASKRPKTTHMPADMRTNAHTCSTPDGDEPMTMTLLRMLLDEVRDVKEENDSLRHQAAKSRARRKESEARMRAMEERMLRMEHSMRTMAHAQREHSMQITSLLSLFQQAPARRDAALTDASQSSSDPYPTTTSVGLSCVVVPASPAPPSFTSPFGESLCMLEEDRALYGRAALLQAFPFLRGYDPAKLIVYDPRQPFLVLRVADFESSADMEELVGKSIVVLGSLDVNAKLDLIQPMLNPVPPSRMSQPIHTCPIMRPKGCEPVLIEAVNQCLWVDSRVKWSLVLIKRVLKEGVNLPLLHISELLDDPHLKAMVDARLVGAERSFSSAQLPWPNMHELTDASDVDGVRLPAGSATSHHPEPEEEEEQNQHTTSPSTTRSTESSLDEILRSLQAIHQPDASPRPPDLPSPALEYERWLL